VEFTEGNEDLQHEDSQEETERTEVAGLLPLSRLNGMNRGRRLHIRMGAKGGENIKIVSEHARKRTRES